VAHATPAERESAAPIPADGVLLDGDLTAPPDARSIAVLA
jgi:hypothetical protein